MKSVLPVLVLAVLVVVGLLAAVLVKAPHIFLILGILSASAATVFTCMGKVWVRFSGWLYRAEKAGWFWWNVALYYLIWCFFDSFRTLKTELISSTPLIIAAYSG